MKGTRIIRVVAAMALAITAAGCDKVVKAKPTAVSVDSMGGVPVIVGTPEGDILYARIAWDMDARRKFRNIFRESKLAWPRTKRGFLLLQKQYPDSLAVTSEFCHLAGTAGDWPTAKALFVKLGGKIDLTIWEEEKRYVECRKWAFAR